MQLLSLVLAAVVALATPAPHQARGMTGSHPVVKASPKATAKLKCAKPPCKKVQVAAPSHP
jgi:hypothetical protein